jgi:Leucine-rich repeat (LRR) protein
MSQSTACGTATDSAAAKGSCCAEGPALCGTVHGGALAPLATTGRLALHRLPQPLLPQITRLRRLRHLDVSSNCLTALPGDLPPSLTHLDASNNSRVVSRGGGAAHRGCSPGRLTGTAHRGCSPGLLKGAAQRGLPPLRLGCSGARHQETRTLHAWQLGSAWTAPHAAAPLTPQGPKDIDAPGPPRPSRCSPSPSPASVASRPST